MMHLVRGNASAASPSAGDSDSLSARQVLQASMARKRRNDAIRQQEFAQLRLLRQRHAAQGPSSKPSSPKDEPLSSMLGHETRSTATLQKIDAIEAQMSGQWWRNAPTAAAQAGSATAGDTASPNLLPGRVPDTLARLQLPVLGEDSVVQPAAPVDTVCAAVQPEAAEAPLSRSAPPAVVPAPPQPLTFQHHADLEEAAILFAHGDIEAARTRLLEQLVLVLVLGAEPVDKPKAAVLWHAVLDLCRATGDEEAFEPLAIDYAEHFGRSAPPWWSMPARLGLPPLCGAAQMQPSRQQFQWSCPAMLTVGAVTALRAAHEDASQPWSMSWLRLTSIDEAALTPLTKLVHEWASQPGQLVLSDAGKLLDVLARHTPAGQASLSPQWWALHMAVLRLMNRPDAYEQVALDYCVTYEVSPPSWEAPRCDCVVQEEGEVDASVLQTVSRQSAAAAHAPDAGLAQWAAAGTGKPCLAGVLEGDPQPWLDALRAQAQPGQVLEVSCANLIRLDFVAAGSILNWAAEMQSQGYRLCFTQVHHLVAAFFHVIGIHEHATVQATLA